MKSAKEIETERGVYEKTDVTELTIPAVPRENVQEAVNEMKLAIGRVAEGMYCEGDDPRVSEPIINAYADSINVITNHTGVTPTEVLRRREMERTWYHRREAQRAAQRTPEQQKRHDEYLARKARKVES
jgi:hypothetical protein